LFIGTSLPQDVLTEVVDIGDKVKHFGAYLGLAVLLSLNLFFQEKWYNLSKFYLQYTFIIITLYGLVDEIHQLFVPNRSAEFYDWLADTLGGLLGLIIVYFFIKMITRNKSLLETK
jgi:VanZ family protein